MVVDEEPIEMIEISSKDLAKGKLAAGRYIFLSGRIIKQD